MQRARRRSLQIPAPPKPHPNSPRKCRYLIDAVGLDAQLNHPIRRLKILLRDIERAKAELGDYAEEPLCIAPPKAGQKIDISRRARYPMKSARPGAHDHVLNAV